MTRSKLYAVAFAIAIVCSGILVNVYAMPEFMLLASPGVVLGLMAAGNTPDNNNLIIFFGNALFYSFIFLILTELALLVRKAKTR